MKKIWVLKKENEIIYGNTNYYTFCGNAKKILLQADTEIIDALKNSLGAVPFSPEIKEQFRIAHQTVQKKFKVEQGEIPEENSSRDTTGYKEVKDCNNILIYLWSIMRNVKK